MGAVSTKVKGPGKRVRMTLNTATQDLCLPVLHTVLRIRESYERDHVIYMMPLQFCEFMSELSKYPHLPKLNDLNIEYVSLGTEPVVTHVKG